MKDIGKSGKLNVNPPKGKYVVWARCYEMSCQRRYKELKITTLDNNKVIKLEWVAEY